MAEHEPDGIDEAFLASARVALTAGGPMAERALRAREHRRCANSRRACTPSGAPARAQLAPVAGEDHDADAARTVEQMRDELRRRYPIDYDSLGAEPAAVQDALVAASLIFDILIGVVINLLAEARAIEHARERADQPELTGPDEPVVEERILGVREAPDRLQADVKRGRV